MEQRIGKYSIHPAAGLFPLLEGEEYEKFKASIQQQGQQETIKVRGDLLIDGRNRLRACLELGIEPRIEEFTGDDMAAGHYILAANLFRRHLHDDQRAFIAARALRLITARQAYERQVDAGRQGIEGGDGRGNKKTLRPESDEGFSRDHHTANKNSTRGQIAQVIKTKRHKVDQAIRVVDHGTPELQQQVEAGAIALCDAIKQLPPSKGDHLHTEHMKLRSSQARKGNADREIEEALVRCAALPQPVRAADILAQFRMSCPKNHSNILAAIRHCFGFGRIVKWFHAELVSVNERDIRYRITVDHDLRDLIDDYRPVGPRGESQSVFLNRLESTVNTRLEEQKYRASKPWNVENTSKMALLQGQLDVLKDIRERQSCLRERHNFNHGGHNSIDEKVAGIK